MSYEPDGVREVYLFDFSTREKQIIMKFVKKDGIISHCKLSGSKSSLKVTYVKECKTIMIFDVKSK